MRASKRNTEREEARTKLRALLPPGSTVYTILRHVSRSGMARDISPVLDNDDISWLVARALGERVHQRHGGIRMGGCGMDMGFALVYELSQALYPDGFGCIGEGCPSNDHSNGDRDYTPSAQHWHRSGGYALRHRWL